MKAPSSLEFPFAGLPAPGSVSEVASGVFWLRMPLPFELDHINLWLLADDAGAEAGWTIVDTGIGKPATRELWERIFVGTLAGRPVRRVIATHYHPDHVGNAAWLCERFGTRLWMTRGEFLTAHAVCHGVAAYTPEATRALFRANGLDDARGSLLLARGDLYRALVPAFPLEHRRLMEGDRFSVGGRD